MYGSIQHLASEGEVVLLLEGKARAVLGVELREPPPVLDDELVLPHQEWLEVVSLVVPQNHVSFKLQESCIHTLFKNLFEILKGGQNS